MILALLLFAPTSAFTFTASPRTALRTKFVRSSFRSSTLSAVLEVDSESAFDSAIQAAGASLVVIDYSTTWCGPVCNPNKIELSDILPNLTLPIFIPILSAR